MTTHTATELNSAHDLLAAVPFMVGYHPTNSLVAMAIVNGKISMAMRVDFPAPDIMEATCHTIAMHLVREKASEAIVVGYLPEPCIDSNPLSTICDVLEQHDVLVKESLKVSGDRFVSTLCHNPTCCPLEGNPLPPLSESRVTVEQIAAGNPMPFLDLDHLKNSIASVEPDKELLDLIENQVPIDYEYSGFVMQQRLGAEAVNELVAEFTSAGISTNKPLIALVISRLMDLQVRDYAMGMVNPENALTLWDMWRWLLTIAPDGYVSPVASIFAVMSYERGDGALAQRALDRALADNSTYPMAKLLRRTFAAGWPPSAFSQMRAELHPKICESLFGSVATSENRK